MKIERNVFINSLAVFVLTYFITQLLHESAHALTGLIAGASPTLHHNYVHSNADVSQIKQTLIAAAGPLYSFFQAVVCFIISRRMKKSVVVNLFWTWMMLWGYIGFFGYIFMTPFFNYGDTGFVAEQLHVPETGRLVIGACGIAAFFFISTISLKKFAHLWRDGEKKVFFDNVIFFPLIAGVVLTTLLNLPVPTFLSLLAPLCMPWCVMMVYGKLLGQKDLKPETSKEPNALNNFSKLLFMFLVIVLLINRILVFGIKL
jgi:hypothetical protein